MELDQLRALIAVVDNETFEAAAGELRLTPSTWPNAAHTPGEKIPAAVRSAPASPNSEIPSV